MAPAANPQIRFPDGRFASFFPRTLNNCCSSFQTQHVWSLWRNSLQRFYLLLPMNLLRRPQSPTLQNLRNLRHPEDVGRGRLIYSMNSLRLLDTLRQDIFIASLSWIYHNRHYSDHFKLGNHYGPIIFVIHHNYISHTAGILSKLCILQRIYAHTVMHSILKCFPAHVCTHTKY